MGNRVIRKRLKEGFTLVELMIVVAIVGVLAVLAVYGVRKYIANAKTAEAKNSLGQLAKDAVTAYEGEHMAATVLGEGGTTAILREICGTATASVPVASADIQGKKYQSSKADWSNPADLGSVAVNPKGYPCLKFEMTAAQYFQYSYVKGGPAGNGATVIPATATGFAAAANGDLSGDLTLSTFGVTADLVNGRVLVSPSISEDKPEE